MKSKLLFGCIAMISCLAAGPLSYAETKVKIGVSLPLSGGSASEGQDLRSLLSFANHVVANDAYELEFEDDRCSEKDAVTIARKFVDVDHVEYVLGYACSGALLAAAPIYERAKIPTIALAAGAPAISHAGDYIFRTIPSLNIAAQRLADDAARKYKRIGILSEQTAYAQGLAQAFFDHAGGRLEIVREDYLPETSDFRDVLLRLQRKEVQALFLNPQSEIGMMTLYQQLLRSGIKLPVYGTYYPGFAAFLKKFAKEADGIVFADLPFVETALTNQSRQLYDRYKKEHGVPQSSQFYFVTALAAFNALHRAATSGTDPKQYLYEQAFPGLFGEYFFDSNGDVQGDRLTFVLKTIKGGQARAAS